MASDRVVTVPNLLSLARLVLAVVFFVAVERGWPVAAFWLFVVAASTDWVDGWYARRFDQVSRLGRIFDPLVDKVIVCGAVVLLAAAGTAIAPWMAVVVIVRELMVTAIRAEMEKAGRDFSAAFSGKLKMVLQCVAIGLVLAALTARVMSVVLFDVQPLDPAVFGGVALTLALTGTLACLLPARRATRVDPSHAMRSE